MTTDVDWLSMAHLESFRASDNSAAYRRFLSDIAIGPVGEREYAFHYGSFRERVNDEPIEFCSVYFPPNVIADVEARKDLLTIEGLKLNYGYLRGGLPYLRMPHRGFALMNREWQGQTVGEMIFQNTWQDEKSEEDFKRNARMPITKVVDGRTTPESERVYDVWIEQLLERGMLGYGSEHFYPRKIRPPSYMDGI